jgi:hypothetical protein
MVGDAMQLLAQALQAGSQPPERTVVALSSFPALKELQKLQARAAQSR